MEFQKKSHMKFKKNDGGGGKLELVDFSLINWSGFEPIYELALRKYCAQRKHRIKILTTVWHRYHNDLYRMVFRFLILSTGPM